MGHAARAWLAFLGVAKAIIDHVCEIIGDLSCKGIEQFLARFLAEWDEEL